MACVADAGGPRFRRDGEGRSAIQFEPVYSRLRDAEQMISSLRRLHGAQGSSHAPYFDFWEVLKGRLAWPVEYEKTQEGWKFVKMSKIMDRAV